MIVRSLCNSCFQPYELLIEASDIDLLKQIADEAGHTAPCPRLCGGRINLVGEPVIDHMRTKFRESMNITGKELYQAVNGLGLADEVPKDITSLTSILRANRVVGVDIEEVDNRFYLHELKLEGGVTFHLASGPRGAQVLKVTQEPGNGSAHHR